MANYDETFFEMSSAKWCKQEAREHSERFSRFASVVSECDTSWTLDR